MIRIIQITILLATLKTFGQVYTPVNQNRILTSAFPFQNFTYDARSAALGEAGVAITPDVYSAWMNPAKLPFLEQKDSSNRQNTGTSLHYTPYYRSLIQGMNLYGLSLFRANQKQAFGLTLKYFDDGITEIRNSKRELIKQYATKEYSINGFYARHFKKNNSVGVGLKYTYSDLYNRTQALSGDVYFYHDGKANARGKNTIQWLNYGASLTSIGGKVRYNDYKKRSFQPTLLKIGLAQNFLLGKHQSRLMLTANANKLLVPTPAVRDVNNQVIRGKNEENISGIGSIFQSWATAPDGFSETLKEVTFSCGSEFQFRQWFSARVGYYTQNKLKGNLKYYTLGLGVKYKGFGLDAAYLLPRQRNVVLSNTFRLSGSYLLNR